MSNWPRVFATLVIEPDCSEYVSVCVAFLLRRLASEEENLDRTRLSSKWLCSAVRGLSGFRTRPSFRHPHKSSWRYGAAYMFGSGVTEHVL